MISYAYFDRRKIAPEDLPSQSWDVFISAWDGSPRVEQVFQSVQAKYKAWLYHPEYEDVAAQKLAGNVYKAVGGEADGIRNLFEFLSRSGLSFPETGACIDITGMMRPHIAFLVKFLKMSGIKSVDFLYSEPNAYQDGENTRFTSGDVSEIHEVEGFGGINLVGAEEVLIIAPGFDDALLREVITHKERAQKQIQIFGFPPLQADMYQQNVLKAYSVEEDPAEETRETRRFASASDPFSMAAELSRIVQWQLIENIKSRFYIAPLATKAQTLGAALFYITECEGKPVSLLYPVVSGHAAATSTGLARVWVNTIDFELCDALTSRARAQRRW
jgi:hypothetical protein